jgi:hypothetical protein
VQLVFDWPINTRIKAAHEYKEFFEWVEHLNN